MADPIDELFSGNIFGGLQNSVPVDPGFGLKSIGEPIQEKKRPDPKKFLGMSVNQVVDEEIIAMVNTRQKVSEEGRRQKRERWDTCWEHINSVYNSSGKANWQSKVFMPASIKVGEIITANLTGALLGPHTPAEFRAKHQDKEDLIRAHNKIMKDDMEKSKFKIHFTDFIRTLVYLGSAIGKVDYNRKEENVMIKERVNVQKTNQLLQSLGMQTIPSEKFTSKKMLVKDFSQMTNIDPYNFYPQPGITDITKDTWVIEKRKITNKELIDGSNHPDPFYRYRINDEMLQSGISRGDELDPERQIRNMSLLQGNIPTHFMDPDREHELMEYWGPVPMWYFKPELRNDRKKAFESVYAWLQVVDNKWLVLKRQNPWRDAEPPYVKGDYIRVPNSFWGIGPIEIMIGLQIEKNELRNSRLDNINLIMNKVVAVMKDMVEDYDRLISGPGNLWVFKGIDDIRKAFTTVNFEGLPRDAWVASQEGDNEIEESTAAVKATVGVGGSPSEAGGGTFRGQLLNKQSATERFMGYARVLEICGLGTAFKKMYDRVYQFKDLESMMQILGPRMAQDFQPIVPEEMDKIASINPLGVSNLEHKGLRLAQLTDFMKVFGQFEWTKKMEIARKIWQEMGNNNPDDVIFSDEEIREFNEIKRGLMGVGGGGGNRFAPPGSQGNRAPNVISGNAPGPIPPQSPELPQGPGVNSIDVAGRPLS